MEETFGRYRLLEPLGRGGMAEVFKAKSFGVEGFEKVLVVKRILPELAKDRRFIELFVHEAKLAVRLSHANIVQAFDLGKVSAAAPPDPDSYYIAMEYVAGLDVASLLARARFLARQLPIGLCLFITAEVAKGLDHAHRRCDEQREPLNIVHRDVSPQNILLSWEGEVKITDFGIAKAREACGSNRSIRGGRLSGKAAYMSPEQARSDEVDARSDIFSLGTVLYELLTGVNPFRALTPGDTLERVKRGEVQPVQLLRPDVSDELASIIMRALAVDPEERFESAGRLHDDILAFMYASGTRFSSNDLIEFLDEFRDVDPSEFEVGDILSEGLPAVENEVTPAELPSVRPPENATPVRITTRLPVFSYASSLGERREATLLVLGLGDEERWVSDDLRRRVKDTLGRYGARLIEEEPTRLVSLFGLGDADGRDTETAVRCALVLLRLLATGRALPRASVHSGMIHLHESGEPARDDNMAALMRVADDLALLAEGRCVVSSTAARQVRNLFVLDLPSEEARALVPTPGFVVGEARTADDALRRFVGREQELQRLAKILGAAARRQLRVVTVRGEQGMGKTRFLHALDRRLRRRAYNIGFYMASCPPRGMERPLSGLTTMLRVLCGIEEGDSEARVSEVEPRLRALGLTDEERSAVLGQLGACEVEVTGPAVPPLRAAFTRMLQRLCEDRIHAFVFDDAQSLDADSWDVLSYAVQRLTNLRAVIVLATRSFEDHALVEAKLHEVLELGELDDADTEQLVAARAGLTRAPRELVAFCRERAGGHPLFLEELVKELVEAGALEVRDGELVKLRLTGGEVAVPRHLRSLLGSRIARLSAETKAVLHAAAVLGDPADSEVLSAMLAVPLKQIDAALTDLEERGMVRRAGPSSGNLASPMLREVVLESIAVEGKQRIHAAAVAAYECVLGEQAATIADRLAAHLLEAGQRDRAARLLIVSAQRRSKSGQLEAAVQEFLRAMNLVEFATATGDELLTWLEDMRGAVHRVRVAPNLEEILDNVLERVDASDHVRQRVLARVHGASMLAATHVFDRANSLAEQALSLAGHDELLQAKALLVMGAAHGMRGEFRLAVDAYAKISPSAKLDPGDAYRLQIGLAQSLGASGEPVKALAHLDRAARSADSRDLGAAVEREKLRALICHFSRDFHEAAAASQRGVEIARAAGLSYEIALGLHNLGDSLLWLDESARAHAAFQQSLAVCERFGYGRLLNHNRMYLIYLDGDQGDAKAIELLRELIREADGSGLTWDALNGRYLLGSLALKTGERDVARRELERVYILARECKSHLLEQSARELLEGMSDGGG